MNSVLAIAAGGAVGAVLRHFLTRVISTVPGEFPWGVMTCNILGSFIMGALVAYFAHVFDPPQAVKVFLTTGLLGAFTTFSTFSLESVMLYQRGDYYMGLFYVAGSVALSIVALFAGQHIVRGIVA